MGLVLVLGYRQFGRYLFNTCEAIVDALNGSRIGDAEVKAFSIPVSLKFVREEVPRILESLRPSIVIGLGMAPGFRRVVVEMVATNLATFEIPDSDRYVANHEEIYLGEPTIIELPIPREAILEKCIKVRKLPMKLGLSIGTYLCNALAYTIARYARRSGALGAFMHVPMHSDYALRNRFEGPTIPLRDSIECVKCVIEACLEASKDIAP